MFRAILRTGLSLGTIFAAGYIARRYFGTNEETLPSKGKTSADLKAPLKDVADRHAI